MASRYYLNNMQNNFKKRKPLRLKNFNYSTQNAYFLTICTKDRQNILSDIITDKNATQIQLTQIGKIAEKYILSTNNVPNVTVDNYVIMPNHIHLVISVGNGLNDIAKTNNGTTGASSPTGAVIPRTVAAFKRLCNKEIGKNIFQRSYNDRIIRNQQEYDKIIKYMQQNPEQWQFDKFFN